MDVQQTLSGCGVYRVMPTFKQHSVKVVTVIYVVDAGDEGGWDSGHAGSASGSGASPQWGDGELRQY